MADEQNKSGGQEPAAKGADAQTNLQNILAILLVVSLVANVYFMIQLTAAPSGQVAVTTSSTTSSTIPVDSSKIAVDGKIVSLDYVGKFTNGTVFDTSIESEAQNAGIFNSLRVYEPFSFILGSGQAITGFENGVRGMAVGETKTFEVAPEDGYSSGALAGETLVFTVTVTDVKDSQELTVTILNDKRCAECDSSWVLPQLQQIFPTITAKNVDYGSEEGKKIYAQIKSTNKYLPAVLLDENVKEDPGFVNIERYTKEVGSYLLVDIGADFDPTAEVCGNGIDDDGNALVDCDDPGCAKSAACARSEKPIVEAFVMSHCPYGTQIEKGLVPVVELLGDKINFSVKFCDYAMHGEVEVKEELLQYCIQKDFNSQYLAYLKCFLSDGNSTRCVAAAGIDASGLDDCVKKADNEYDIMKDFADKTTWKSLYYPTFKIFQAEVDEYGVQGSPTLVVNGVVREGVSRSPAGLLAAICSAFTEAPEECEASLSTANPTSGFGYDGEGSASSGGCGV